MEGGYLGACVCYCECVSGGFVSVFICMVFTVYGALGDHAVSRNHELALNSHKKEDVTQNMKRVMNDIFQMIIITTIK